MTTITMNRPLQSILLVEDDQDYSHLLNEAFTEAGFRILRAENGERALELLRQEPVDLVVSDFIMPELNGLELCRLLNNDMRLSKVKVVLYSCNADSTFRQKARELGALDYLLKTDANELVRQICDLAGFNGRSQAQPSAHGNFAGDPSPSSLSPKELSLGDLQRLVAVQAGQLRVLFDNFCDFVQIAVPAEPASPAVRLAWVASQRTGNEIKRLLQEMEKQVQEPSAV